MTVHRLSLVTYPGRQLKTDSSYLAGAPAEFSSSWSLRTRACGRRPPALPLWIHQHFGGGVRERTVPGGASLPYRHCPDLQASWHGRIKEAPVNKSHVRITHAPVLPASLDLSEPAARGCSTAGEKIALGVMHVQPAGRLYIPVI
jgi:hypothetical protein